MKHNRNFTKLVLMSAVLILAAGCIRAGDRKLETIIPPKDSKPTSSPITITKTASGKPPQFVVMAFDGSKSFDMWGKTLNFSKDMTNQGHPIHFTYFLSGVYFLNWRKADRYTPPHGKPGDSLIGFADSNLDVEKRVSFVNRAIAEGHEIGSHLNGHYDGSKWTAADWQEEQDSFKKLIFSVPENNDVSEKDASNYILNLKSSDVVGFRAPDLGNNKFLWPMLKNNGYLYDTSLTSKPDQWPSKTLNGLWEFPLAKIQYATTTSSLLSMDYNFYFKQSQAKDVAVKGSDLWNKFYNDTYNSYINYFSNNYTHNRAPVFIGSHFSEWNDGVYWESMRDFASSVCGKPEVYCVTFGELRDYLEKNPVSN